MSDNTSTARGLRRQTGLVWLAALAGALWLKVRDGSHDRRVLRILSNRVERQFAYYNTVTRVWKPTRSQCYERFLGLIEVLNESDAAIEQDFESGVAENDTGYERMYPKYVFDTVDALLSLDLEEKPISLDLGCGNGLWALAAAAAGFPSYGIDASEYLIERSKENHRTAVERGLIDAGVTCKFAVGNIYPYSYKERYVEFALRNRKNEGTMPLEFSEDPYGELGLGLEDVGLVYAFTWIDQMPFLLEFVQQELSDGTILVLPHYHPSRFKGVLRVERLRTGRMAPFFVRRLSRDHRRNQPARRSTDLKTG